MPRSRRSVPLLCVLCLVALTLCVHADAAFATEVLYAQVNTSILTYTVDVNSLEPTLVGSPLLLQGLPEFVQVVPSPNDHFLYILSGQQRGQVRMSVYATDASGVPQTPAVQILSPAPISQFAIDPNGRFAFAFEFQDFHRIGTRTINNLHLAVGQTGVLVYPLTTNPKNPIIQCTSAMLMACGAAGDFWQDPTGTYLLLQLRNTFDIAKISIADKEIVDTGSTFPATQTPYFSRDEAIMYGVQYNFDHVSVIQVYGFDANSGALTTGGQASVPASLWSVVAAQRQ